MRYRTLGKTGLEVSELGFGAWGIGGTGWMEPTTTNPCGLSGVRSSTASTSSTPPTRTATATANNSSAPPCASRQSRSTSRKIPPKNMEWPARRGLRPEEVFPADWIVACTEGSLLNLGLETIDIQQFHVWSDEWVDQRTGSTLIERLKREGKIRFFGVSINDHQPENAIRLVESGLVDTVQVIYNVFDQSPEDALFAAVETARVGVIVRVPFDEGALTGSVRPETTFPEGDFRNGYFAGERKREVWETSRRSPETSTSGSSSWERSRSASASATPLRASLSQACARHAT